MPKIQELREKIKYSENVKEINNALDEILRLNRQESK